MIHSCPDFDNLLFMLEQVFMISLSVYAIIISLFFIFLIVLLLIVGLKIKKLIAIAERFAGKAELTFDAVRNFFTIENIIRYLKKGADDEWK